MHNVPAMRAAIDNTGRNMVYYVDADTSERVWDPRTLKANPRAARTADELPQSWGPKYNVTMWKTWKDIYDTDDRYDTWWHVMDNVAHNARGTELSQSCGHFNMPDMMTIGQGGQSFEEYRSQMALWSIMAAPLILGADIRELGAADLAIVTNPHLLAVNRDPNCVMGSDARALNGAQVWVKPLTPSTGASNYISFAVVVLNTNDDTVVDIPVVFSDYYRGDFDPADFSAARVYDLWKGGELMGSYAHNFTAKAVAPHSCRAVRMDVTQQDLVSAAAGPVLKTTDSSAVLGVWAWDDWPSYNGSATDCTNWDWSIMRDQYITTPYNPGSSPVFALAESHNVHMIHTPEGSTVEALIPHLPSATARAKFVAAEAAKVTHADSPWAGSVLGEAAAALQCSLPFLADPLPLCVIA